MGPQGNKTVFCIRRGVFSLRGAFNGCFMFWLPLKKLIEYHIDLFKDAVSR